MYDVRRLYLSSGSELCWNGAKELGQQSQATQPSFIY